MKRLLLLVTLAGLLAGLLVLASCSNPLDSPNIPPPLTVVEVDTLLMMDTMTHVDTVEASDTVLITDTVLVTDTLIVSDTVVITDTIVIADTILHVDTLYEVDTVVIYLQDSCDAREFCARLSSHQKEIVWMLSNSDDDYRLEFTAEVERDHPRQVLEVQIDDETYTWCPSDSREFSVDTELDDDATVRITITNPMAWGHPIDVCMTLTELDEDD